VAERSAIERVLVIKHGALGDIVLACGPFAAIRRHHQTARITLLTTAAFADVAESSPYFDDVWVDDKPRVWQVNRLRALRNRLRAARFERVYDLQTSDRSSAYLRLLGRPRPEWSGIARGCSHPDRTPERNKLHTIERQAAQLSQIGIGDTPTADVSWLDDDISALMPNSPFVLFVPGGAPHRPRKRWPVSAYGELARQLSGEGITPVLLGTGAEAAELAEIREYADGALNLCNKTSLGAIAALARRALAAVGSDTGPMHLIAAAGCPSIVLFSSESDPALSAPRGKAVEIVQRPDLASLPASLVLDHLHPHLRK